MKDVVIKDFIWVELCVLLEELDVFEKVEWFEWVDWFWVVKIVK